MGQIGVLLRKTISGHSHWCPGCEQTHIIPNGWQYDANISAPTFNPSVRITGKQTVWENGEWTGEWVRDADGNTVDFCCHYFLHAGQLKFCDDSTHALAGQTVPLPPLPTLLSERLLSKASQPLELLLDEPLLLQTPAPPQEP